jgi:hypothetical protein
MAEILHHLGCLPPFSTGDSDFATIHSMSDFAPQIFKNPHLFDLFSADVPAPQTEHRSALAADRRPPFGGKLCRRRVAPCGRKKTAEKTAEYWGPWCKFSNGGLKATYMTNIAMENHGKIHHL